MEKCELPGGCCAIKSHPHQCSQGGVPALQALVAFPHWPGEFLNMRVGLRRL